MTARTEPPPSISQAIPAIELESMVFMRNITVLTARQQTPVLDRSAYLVLSCLVNGGPMSIGEMSTAMGLDASTLNRQTTAMSTAGMILRIPDPSGGIARKFRVTELGQSRLHDACLSTAGALARATSEWSPADLDTLARVLERFNRSIEAMDERSWPRPSSPSDSEHAS